MAACLSTLAGTSPALATDQQEAEILAGHSNHGEAFNEGPRQAAYLISGMGNIDFPITTDDPKAQDLFNQGVAQLHGFWYYEAERSFRQAAVADPDCAMLYWGMAMANFANDDRAEAFMAEARKRQELASDSEQRYIQALSSLLTKKTEGGESIDEKTRRQNYIHGLETIIENDPDDIEAKAFLAVALWQSQRAGLPIVSHVAVDALLSDVFEVNPQHPAHHYRIHLWDRHKPERALESAAKCGPSLPGVAHMWHMPGHIYSRLHRYHDAVWQQEASARVDHAHMVRDRILPDQIHNFAHNNEWLIRNLLKIGRVNDALSLAKNMQELPRHPKYNRLTKRGSTRYGRERLELSLETYRLWPQIIELSTTEYLEPTDEIDRQIKRLRLLGSALAMEGSTKRFENVLTQLEARLTSNQEKIDRLIAAQKEIADREDKTNPDSPESSSDLDDTYSKSESSKSDDPGEQSTPCTLADEPASKTEIEDETDTVTNEDKANADQKDAKAERTRRVKEQKKRIQKLKRTRQQLEQALAAINAFSAAASNRWCRAIELYEQAELDDPLLYAEWLAENGDWQKAFDVCHQEIEDHPGELLPLAVEAWLQYRQTPEITKTPEFQKDFEDLRNLAASADIQTPLLARLAVIAEAFDLPNDWRGNLIMAEDSGVRPPLDSLGPFRWHPYQVPEFCVANTDGQICHGDMIQGKPTLVIFYLGFGCLHCVEQLQAFSPRAQAFQDAGIDMMAISTEDHQSLERALENYSETLSIPLYSDPDLAAFRSFRCYDDFEQQPLHGTFLIDPRGDVLWQDISYEPFMDVDFILQESIRQLKLAGFKEDPPLPKRHQTDSIESTAAPALNSQ